MHGLFWVVLARRTSQVILVWHVVLVYLQLARYVNANVEKFILNNEDSQSFTTVGGTAKQCRMGIESDL